MVNEITTKKQLQICVGYCRGFTDNTIHKVLKLCIPNNDYSYKIVNKYLYLLTDLYDNQEEKQVENELEYYAKNLLTTLKKLAELKIYLEILKEE